MQASRGIEEQGSVWDYVNTITPKRLWRFISPDKSHMSETMLLTFFFFFISTSSVLFSICGILLCGWAKRNVGLCMCVSGGFIKGLKSWIRSQLTVLTSEELFSLRDSKCKYLLLIFVQETFTFDYVFYICMLVEVLVVYLYLFLNDKIYKTEGETEAACESEDMAIDIFVVLFPPSN